MGRVLIYFYYIMAVPDLLIRDIKFTVIQYQNGGRSFLTGVMDSID